MTAKIVDNGGKFDSMSIAVKFTDVNETPTLVENVAHTCASCPLGASCKGSIGWSQVKAKFGWWRLKVAEDRKHPPECLTDHTENSQPPCAFAECLNPIACLALQYKFPPMDTSPPLP